MSTHELEHLDYSKVPKFSLKDNIYEAKVIQVYDGDTITAIFKFADKFFKWNCRLDGIDTPEMKSKNVNEKSRAIEARDFLREKILGKIVQLYCKDFDKDGRLLVDVKYNEDLMNDLMIKEGFAKAYFGGTKEEWNL